MKVKTMSQYLAIFLLLYTAIFLYTAKSYGWIIGQNRIVNTNFENDKARQPPMEWVLEKGG